MLLESDRIMKKTNDDFVKEIIYKFRGNISVVDEYVNKTTKIKFYCNHCKEYFYTTPNSILNTKYGCKICSTNAIKEKLSVKNLNKSGKMIDVNPELICHWDFEKNFGTDINTISPQSGKNVWWICSICNMSYRAKVCNVVNSKNTCVCADCYHKTMPQLKIDTFLYRNGSFADNFPHLLDEWDYELNVDVDPQKFTNKSNKKVWWKCKECGRGWAASIAKRVEERGCPYCAKFKKSKLQIKIEDYISENYLYKLMHEYDCSISCVNPKTGFRMPYDNEIVVSENCRLIIEVMGQQHYEITLLTKLESQKENCTPEDVLNYQQYKDDIKKDYVESLNGYYYLAIPYTAERNEQYKSIIDNKISEILSSEYDVQKQLTILRRRYTNNVQAK